jgi:F420-0:gamma-glutamyl ligase-like protein
MQPLKYFAVLPQAPPATVVQELLHKRMRSERFADVSVVFADTKEGLLGGTDFTFIVASLYNEQVTRFVIHEILARFQCTKVNVQKVIGEARIGGPM